MGTYICELFFCVCNDIYVLACDLYIVSYWNSWIRILKSHEKMDCNAANEKGITVNWNICRKTKISKGFPIIYKGWLYGHGQLPPNIIDTGHIKGIWKKVVFNQLYTYLPQITCSRRDSTAFERFLFIYMNDLPNASEVIEFILFSVDTDLFNNWMLDTNVNETLNSELSEAHDWPTLNKLTLNITKTKFMIFHPIQKHNRMDTYHGN